MNQAQVLLMFQKVAVLYLALPEIELKHIRVVTSSFL
jgi:hypothetical protein